MVHLRIAQPKNSCSQPPGMTHDNNPTSPAAGKPMASPVVDRMKRAYHNKVRTGCKTCKIRRIRCDEGKPACTKCVSTGRKCDGYPTSSTVPIPQAPWSTSPRPSQSRESTPDFLGSDLALKRYRGTPEEMKSYSFFMEVTAPCMAVALHTDFWMYEIPRISDSDSAVWHAAVSLGAIHSNYVKEIRGPEANQFALQHYNSAIRSLTETYNPRERWRALTLSTIFTCLCILDCQYAQARLHFQSGSKILQEFARDDLLQDNDEAAKILEDLPVSLSSIRSMLISFELIEIKLDPKKTSQAPLLLSEDDNYCLWRSYTLPPSIPGRAYLTTENLSKAIKAAESFFMALVIQTHQHAKNTKKVYLDGCRPCRIFPPEREFHRVFKEIDKVIALFKVELDRKAASKMRYKKAYLSLCIIHAANRFSLARDPDEPDEEKRCTSLPTLCENIVDMSEEVLNLGGNLGGLSISGPVATSTVMNPLLVVARSGAPISVRHQAIKQLYRPRLEGIWDSRLGASMGEAIIRRETAATQEYRKMPELENLQLVNVTARPWGSPNDEDYIHPLARICNISMAFMEGRNVLIWLRTWREWLHDLAPEEEIVSW